MLMFMLMLFLGANFARTDPRFADFQCSEFWATFVSYLDLIHREAKSLTP